MFYAISFLLALNFLASGIAVSMFPLHEAFTVVNGIIFPILGVRLEKTSSVNRPVLLPVGPMLVFVGVCALGVWLCSCTAWHLVGWETRLLIFMNHLFSIIYTGLLGKLICRLLSDRRWVVPTGLLILGLVDALLIVYRLTQGPSMVDFSHWWGVIDVGLFRRQLNLDPSIIAFRCSTMVRIGLIVYLLREPHKASPFRLKVALSTAFVVWGIIDVCLGSCFLYRVTHAKLERYLPLLVEAENVKVFFPADTPNKLAREIAEQHVFRLAQVCQKLDLTFERPIRSYIFANSAERTRFTKSASMFSKPHLASLYTHGLSVRSAAVPHELTHILATKISPPLGLSLTQKGGISTGFMEGFAQAMTPPLGALDLHHGAATLRERNMLPAINQLMSAGGFAVHHPYIAYVSAGSFVTFMLETLGADAVKAAYRGGISPVHLANTENQWHLMLSRLNVGEVEKTYLQSYLDPPRCDGDASFALQIDACHDNTGSAEEFAVYARVAPSSGERARALDRLEEIVWKSLHRPAARSTHLFPDISARRSP